MPTQTLNADSFLLNGIPADAWFVPAGVHAVPADAWFVPPNTDSVTSDAWFVLFVNNGGSISSNAFFSPPINPNVPLPLPAPNLRTCPVKITCPGIDSPVANFSSEGADPLIFVGTGFGPFNPYQPPPLGKLFTDQVCGQTAVSTFSQEEADLLAAQYAYLCQNPGSFTNQQQEATATCPDGTVNTYTVAAGFFAGPSQAAANAFALAYAEQQVATQLVCINGGIHGGGGVGNTTHSGWACLNQALSLQSNFYNISGRFGGLTFSFAVSSGTLPPGISLIQTSPTQAQLQGTPTSTGKYTWKVTASLAPGATYQSSPITRFSFNDSAYILGVSASSISEPIVGTPYNQQITASGGQSPYTYAANSTLPDGLTLSSTGLLSGTMTGGLVPSFQLSITDSNGRNCVQTITFASNVTPDIFSATVSYFGGGQSYPAGNYRVSYVNGAINYGDGKYRLNWRTPSPGNVTPIGYKVNYNGGASTSWIPGTDEAFTTQSQVESANAGMHIDFSHTGGTIGVWLDDNPYFDNAPGSPSPTFSITALP